MLVDEKLNRCGYKVDNKLKAIWEVELDLIQRFDSFCKSHNICYFAWSGTMLGAVRHHGFIPWDDDFDIAVTRDNYEKIIKYADDFAYPYFLQHCLNDREFFLDYIRFRNSETTGMITWNRSPNYNNGIYIDIYVLDGVPRGKCSLNWFYFRKKVYRGILHSFNSQIHRGNYNMLINLLLSQISKIGSYESWYDKYKKLLSSYTMKSSRLALMTHEREVSSKHWCDVNDIKDLIVLKFENITVPVPKNYDHILRNMYGDYMKFPPPEKRGKWHNDRIIFDPFISYKEYLKVHSSERKI